MCTPLWRGTMAVYRFLASALFFLYGEYVVRFSLPDGIFLPCDHGLDFLDKLM